MSTLHKGLSVGRSPPFRLADHPRTALRAWCKKIQPGWLKPDELRAAIEHRDASVYGPIDYEHARYDTFYTM